MKKTPSLLEMLKAGMHFGHLSSKWHPKMAPFIFTKRNNISIINLEETQKMLEKALEFVKEQAKQGKIILFLGTKKQAQDIVEKYAKECGSPYIRWRWLGGTLTNFGIISKVIKKYNQMRRSSEAGEFEKYTKKEQLDMQREIERLKNLVGGVDSLTKIPDILYIVDIKKEKTALIEAKRKGVKVVALCDTNVNPLNVDFVIPANDDSSKSIEMITELICEAIKEGKKEAGAVAEKKQ